MVLVSINHFFAFAAEKRLFMDKAKAIRVKQSNYCETIEVMCKSNKTICDYNNKVKVKM